MPSTEGHFHRGKHFPMFPSETALFLKRVNLRAWFSYVLCSSKLCELSCFPYFLSLLLSLLLFFFLLSQDESQISGILLLFDVALPHSRCLKIVLAASLEAGQGRSELKRPRRSWDRAIASSFEVGSWDSASRTSLVPGELSYKSQLFKIFLNK